MRSPLDGIVVVAVEQAVAAPLATRHLADLGARVIKVERPGSGDFARHYDGAVNGSSSHFVWLNQGKQSIELDIASADGRRVLGALLDRADVVVQNLAPRTARKHGLSAATLVERYPRLVACDISGYGKGGPYSDRKAYDLLIQCESGLVSITGTPDTPAKSGIAVADIAAGMYAFSGVLGALFERERTGAGQAVEVSMLDALGEWMGFPYLYSRYGGRDPRRAGASHATIAPYGPFGTASGQVVNVGVQNDREWVAFCDTVLRRPELTRDERFATNAARVAHRDELDAMVGDVFGTLTVGEAEARLTAAGVAYARQRTMAEFAEHPQLAARQRWRRVDTENGPVQGLVPPLLGDRAPRRVPAVGEHTEEVLAWLGLGRSSEPGVPDRVEDGDGGWRG
jgi:crotonobetainyl-CoA:carnitine CoA-transferase CaiB-like acyl-CoA transferase